MRGEEASLEINPSTRGSIHVLAGRDGMQKDVFEGRLTSLHRSRTWKYAGAQREGRVLGGVPGARAPPMPRPGHVLHRVTISTSDASFALPAVQPIRNPSVLSVRGAQTPGTSRLLSFFGGFRRDGWPWPISIEDSNQRPRRGCMVDGASTISSNETFSLSSR